MEENKIGVSDNLLKTLSVEKLTNLKLDVDSIVRRLNAIEKACDKNLKP